MCAKVSVLMPCYNASLTIREAVESIQRQTLTDFELIAVDDGSTDATLEILRELAQGDHRLDIISCKHRGIVETLATGLENCHSGFVARMDADDFAYPERLALQYAYLQAHRDVDVVGCLVRGFPAENVRGGFRVYINWLNRLATNEEIRREIFIESPLPHPSVMFRKDAVLAAGSYQEHGWAEDYDLWLRLYLAGKKFAKIDQILLDWREHPERLTRTDSRYSLENFLRAKAHYLVKGPLAGRDAVIIWGAGMIGRRLSKHLARNGAPLSAFLEVDEKKVGNTLRGLPIIAYESLPEIWEAADKPVILAAVGARGARLLIRSYLTEHGFKEGIDWWGVA